MYRPMRFERDQRVIQVLKSAPESLTFTADEDEIRKVRA